ncbi:MAG TPA: hypothetical protein VF120_13420 [Ktedonobacterales bacterium]
MSEHDPQGVQWGMPEELRWGEVVAAPATPPHDPLQAERDYLASVDTAYAPAVPASPPVYSAPPAPSAGLAGQPDERNIFAAIETPRTGTLPPRLPDAPPSSLPGALPPLDEPADFGHWGRAPGRMSGRGEPLLAAPPLPRAGRRRARYDMGSGIVGSLRAVLTEPFPRNLVIGIGVVPFVALLAGFLLQTALAGGDWAHGGLAAGVDALLLAGAVAIGIGVRFALGRRETPFLQLGSALLAGLVVVGAIGLAFSHQLHYAQGQAAERTGNFAVAVAQYQLYGETAPHAPDLARAEAAWGEQLVAAKQYANAALHLSNALADNPKDTGLNTQVGKDLYTVYSTWLAAGGEGMPYGDAATFFASYKTSSACDATCQTNVPQLQAQALYLAGAQLASAGDYAQATAEFDQLQAQLPSSTYAGQAHTAGAAAYLAWGQQLLKDPNTCKGANSSSASLTAQYQTLLTEMQTLSDKYGDTAQGKQGAQMLAAPQQVTGTLTGFPSNPLPTIHLSTKADQTHLIFSNNYNVAVDGKTGAFTFPGVTPTDYNLHTEQDLGYRINYQIFHSSSGNLLNIHVGALCPLPLGSIAY